MTVSAAQTADFFAELARYGAVYTIRDAGGYPAPLNHSGARALPFWSLESRARTVVASVPAYAGFDVEQISLEVFREKWLPGLARDGIRVGINWSGARATGYDLTAADVTSRLDNEASKS